MMRFIGQFQTEFQILQKEENILLNQSTNSSRIYLIPC